MILSMTGSGSVIISLIFPFPIFDYFFLEVVVVGAGSVLFAGVVVDGLTFDAVDHFAVPFRICSTSWMESAIASIRPYISSGSILSSG